MPTVLRRLRRLPNAPATITLRMSRPENSGPCQQYLYPTCHGSLCELDFTDIRLCQDNAVILPGFMRFREHELRRFLSPRSRVPGAARIHDPVRVYNPLSHELPRRVHHPGTAQPERALASNSRMTSRLPSRRNPQTAPSIAFMPCEMWAPSNTGPEGHEQLCVRRPARRTISVFVPIRLRPSITSWPSCMRLARIMATWSPPTKPPMLGRK